MPGTPFNLIREDWLPVRRTDGSRDRIAPSGIVANLSNNPVLAIDWPRADFNGATLEFLIGLLATALAPKDKDQWLGRWEDPPEPEDLCQAFERVAFAFDLDGDNPRFMQELGDLEDASEREIAALLIEQPGQQSVERNADHFVKHGAIGTISRATAAIGLYTVQAYSPAGGRGHLTSMRGGGPLTTLVTVDSRDGGSSLWRLLWSNVPYAVGPDWTADPAQVFPWLAATRSSRYFPVTTPEHGHPLQAFWGMPRRVRLVFEPARGRTCDLGGPADDVVAVGWQTRQYGIKYEGWVHPLSPYVERKVNELPTPVKGNPGGVSYRHWLGLVQEDPDNDRLPARCVSVFWSERAEDANISGIGLVAFGYDMDNMKARCWYQAEMPVPNVAGARRETFNVRAARMVWAADKVASLMRSAVKRARFARPADVKGDFSHLTDQFWRDTEARFFDLLNELAVNETDDPALFEGWFNELRRAAFATFDTAAPSERLKNGAWRRLVEARKYLAWNLDGNDIRAILGLASSPDQTKKENAMTDEPANPDVGEAARAWWLDLNRPPEKGGRDRASLAELKRSADSLDIAFVPAFGRLQHGLGAYSERALQLAAMIAHVLAHVREDDGRTVAGALGPYQGDEGAAMSEARFRRLLQARDDADLTRRLVRAVKMLKGKANVADLASAIWWWNDCVRQKWAFRYLNAEPPPGNFPEFTRDRGTNR